MILESCYWKDPLLTSADGLENLRLADDEGKFVRVERELFLNFYGIRKLLDTFKIGDSTRNLTVTVHKHKCLKRVDYFNSHRIDELYDLSVSMPETRDLKFICNQFVHSFVFSIASDKTDNFSGCFVASDRIRNTTLYFIPLSSILTAFRTVGNDYPTELRMHRDPKTGDWIGCVS